LATAIEDVAGTALFRRGVTAGVLLVVLLQIVVGHAHLLLQRIQVQHHVLDAGLVRRTEAVRVGLVEGVDLGLGGLTLAR
jgi:hypothetical protein